MREIEFKPIYDTIILRDTVRITDTIFMAEMPFILRQNCMFYVLDTFALGTEKWFVIDRGSGENDTVKIFYTENNYWIVKYNFRDTVIYRNFIYYDWDTTGNTQGISSLIVRASGSICEGEYPRLIVYVNGERLESQRINKEAFTDYVFLIRKSFEFINEISLEFYNDCWNPETGEDRNITIANMRLNDINLMSKSISLSSQIKIIEGKIWMPTDGTVTVKISGE